MIFSFLKSPTGKIETVTVFTNYVIYEIYFQWQWLKTKLHHNKQCHVMTWLINTLPNKLFWYTADLSTTASSCFSGIFTINRGSLAVLLTLPPWPLTRSPQSHAGAEWATAVTAGRKSIKPSCAANSYLTTTLSGDPAVNSRALAYSMGTREWNLCLRSLCGDMSLCLTSWMFDILFHSFPRSHWNTVCSVSEKWRFRWLSLLKKDWNFRDKTR